MTTAVETQNTNRQVACYVRVSIAGKQAASAINHQRSVCEEALNSCFGGGGYSVEWFVDEGQCGTCRSGRDGDSGKCRPAFTQLIKAVRGGRVHHVITRSLDRLGRDPADLSHFRELLAVSGVDLIITD